MLLFPLHRKGTRGTFHSYRWDNIHRRLCGHGSKTNQFTRKNGVRFLESLLPPPSMKAEKGSATPCGKAQIPSQAEPEPGSTPSWAVGPRRASLPICKMGLIKALISESCKGDVTTTVTHTASFMQWVHISSCYLFIPPLAIK